MPNNSSGISPFNSKFLSAESIKQDAQTLESAIRSGPCSQALPFGFAVLIPPILVVLTCPPGLKFETTMGVFLFTTSALSGLQYGIEKNAIIAHSADLEKLRGNVSYFSALLPKLLNVEEKKSLEKALMFAKAVLGRLGSLEKEKGQPVALAIILVALQSVVFFSLRSDVVPPSPEFSTFSLRSG